MTTSNPHARSGSDELAVLRARVAELEAERLARDVAITQSGVNRQLVETMPVGVVQVGLDGSLQYVNAEGQRILGLSYDEFTSRYVADFETLTIREDGTLLPVEEYPVSRCLHTRKAQPPMTIGVRTPTSEVSWAVYNAAPLIDEQTRAMTAAVVTFVDITPIRTALKESELRFTALAENSVVGFWQVTDDGRTLFVNPSMCRMLDIRGIADLHGRSFRDFFTPESLRIMKSEHAKRPGGVSSSYEVELISKTGVHRRVIISGSPVFDAHGSLHSMIGTFLDITERHRIEREHRNAEQKYHALFEQSPNGVLIIDPENGRIIEANEAFRALVGYTAEQISGMAVDEFDSSESPEAIRARIQKALTEGGDEFDAQVRSTRGELHDVTVRTKVVELGGQQRLLVIIRDTTERKKVEQALETIEQRMRTIITAAPLVLWATDGDGVVTLSEGKALEGLGYKPGQLVGENVFDLYRDRPDIIDVQRRALAGEQASHVSTLGPVTLESRMSPLRDQHGQVTGVIGIAVDITERHRAEQALWLSQQRLTSMVRHTPLAVIGWNTNFEVVEWNPAAEAIFGYTAEEAIGQHATFIIPSEARDHVDEIWKALLRQTGGTRSTNPNVTKTGRNIFCEWYNSPLTKPDGQLIGVASLCEDVTVRLAAEAALKTSEEQLRSVFDSAVDPLWDWDIVADRTTFSPSWPRLLGHKPGELDARSQTWQSLVSPEDLPQVMARLRACLNGEQPDYEAEYRIRTRSGGWVWALSRGRVISRDQHRRPLRMIGSISDITERKRAEQKLRESYEFQRLMLNELDHRVRNNLASLAALIDLTARGTSNVRELATSIKGRVQAMTSVHSLLSRGHWHPIGLRDLLLAVTPQDVQPAITIEGPEVKVAQRQVTALGMIFQELLANSLKYGALSAPGGEGRVAVRWSIGEIRADTPNSIPLDLSWHETGGPPPVASPKHGVGSGLIEGLTRAELRGSATLQFPAAGALHRFVMMLDRVG